MVLAGIAIIFQVTLVVCMIYIWMWKKGGCSLLISSSLLMFTPSQISMMGVYYGPYVKIGVGIWAGLILLGTSYLAFKLATIGLDGKWVHFI